MKLKRKHFLALSLAGIGAIGAFASVSAASIQAGAPTKVRDEVRTAIKQAFTSGDYQAYLATTKDYKIGVPVLTETQFNAMVQADKLRASGDKAGAKALLEQSGLKAPTRTEKDVTRGTTKANRTPLTDAQKATMKQVHELMKAGKQTEAKALLDSAGIKIPEKKVHTSTSTTL
jgi:hypothetical protein